MRHKRLFYQDRRSANKAICAFLSVLCITTIVSIVVFEYLGSVTPLSAQSHVSTAGQSAGLGFSYPQLARARQLLTPIRTQQLDQLTLIISYGAALAQLLQSESSSNHSGPGLSSSDGDLKAFLDEAFSVLKAGPTLLQCHQDETLIAAWSVTAAAQGNSTAGQRHTATQDPSQPRSSNHFLLAANFHNSAAVLPNFVVQTIRLALVVPSGHLAVSVYESGSSDTSRMWLTLLHYLLLPLRTPHNITTAGVLAPRLGLSRIELLARLRNALIEPWLGLQQDKQQQHILPAAVGLPSHRTAVAGSAELSYRSSSFVPDRVVFANDVFWCAEDVMRLLMHDAHIACGMDFYTAPWQQDVQVVAAAAAGAAAGSKVVSDAPVADDDGDDDFLDPVTRELQQTIKHHPASHAAVAGGGGAAGNSAGGLRFYDKWVARDVSGHRLRNRHPFIRLTHSLRQLRAGQPVPMHCCWNGLAVVAAAPFLAHGVRFRCHQPGECAASECSLLCDDFHRLGYRHVVMDSAVRLAYEIEQVNLLGGTAAVTVAELEAPPAAAAAEGDDSSSKEHTLVSGLGPWLPWAQVSETSAQIAAQAQQAASACPQQQQPALPAMLNSSSALSSAAAGCGVLVECCDLQPGRSYVDFKLDCHMVDILAQNFTAKALQPVIPASAQAA